MKKLNLKPLLKKHGKLIGAIAVVVVILLLALWVGGARAGDCSGRDNCDTEGGGSQATTSQSQLQDSVSNAASSSTWSNDYDDFPVDSAAIRYAGDCQAVMNAQGRNFGVGIGSRDRVCQWLSLAQARHLEAAALMCEELGKNSPDADCMQRRAVLWNEGDQLLDRAEQEMDRAGILKKAWRLLF